MPRKKRVEESTPPTPPTPQILQNIRWMGYSANVAGNGTYIQNAVVDITYEPTVLGSAWDLNGRSTSAFTLGTSAKGLHIIIVKHGTTNLTTYATRLRFAKTLGSLSGSTNVYAYYISSASANADIYHIKNLVSTATDPYNVKSQIQDSQYIIQDTTLTPNANVLMVKLNWSSSAIENIQAKITSQSLGNGALMIVGLMGGASISDADAVVLANEINGHYQFGHKTGVVDLDMSA